MNSSRPFSMAVRKYTLAFRNTIFTNTRYYVTVVWPECICCCRSVINASSPWFCNSLLSAMRFSEHSKHHYDEAWSACEFRASFASKYACRRRCFAHISTVWMHFLVLAIIPQMIYIFCARVPGEMLHERDSCRLSYPLHSANDIFTRIACNFSKFAVVPTCIVFLTIFLSFLSIRQFMVLRLQPWKLRSDCFNVDSFCSSTNLGIPTMSD